MKALEFVRSYGPTPLAELTSRLSEGPEGVAQELNELTSRKLLRVTDEEGNVIDQPITADDAASKESWVAELSFRSLRSLLGS